nr:ISKra4 family transposase ISXne1 [Yersinia frederiksenii]
MRLTIQLAMTDESGNTRIEEVLTLEKALDGQDDIGLSVSESKQLKQLLKSVQQSVIQKQADQSIQSHINCPDCQVPRRIKGRHSIQYRTLFGIIPVSGLRVYRCHCEKKTTKTVSLLNDWVGEHTHPELKYIETKWASMIPYGLTADLLKDILPVGERFNASTVRNHLCQVAKRLEAELATQPDVLSGSPRDWEALPKPGKPIVVGIDGGYVRNRDDRKHHFEVITGKSYSAEVPTKRFGFVQKSDGSVALTTASQQR